MKRIVVTIFTGLMLLSGTGSAADDPWYTEGNYAPGVRVRVTLENTLDRDRVNCPVVIPFDDFPVRNLHEMWVTVVDPSLPPHPEPSAALLAKQGGHRIRAETNGRHLPRQLDDLDKDGVWDELFFQTDIRAGERKTIFVYIGFSQRGWEAHGTHAAIGSYCRHIIPFWESKHVGWKLWYPTSADVFAKREPVLMSNELYMENLNGYGVRPEYGSDIARVAGSFGGGAICLFEVASQPDSVSMPRFAPFDGERQSAANWNEGQLEDTRYAFEVVVNGPVRSMIRAKTMNWRTGSGEYAAEQLYTAYTDQSYSTCRVTFPTFLAARDSVMFGCGIRKNAMEFDSYTADNVAVTFGRDELSDPDDDTNATTMIVDFVGNAVAVRDEYSPEYRFVPGFDGNHALAVPVTSDHTFEYMIFAAWSEGQVYNTPESFKAYVLDTVEEYNNPLIIRYEGIERQGSD